MSALRDAYYTQDGLMSAVIITIGPGIGVWQARCLAADIERDAALAGLEGGGWPAAVSRPGFASAPLRDETPPCRRPRWR
ncbi:MAG: hypothetical protein RJA10_2288 [Pseudomonadota bacterium]|jgi:hypothetical protein